MSVHKRITRDFGHPFTGDAGWDLLEATASTATEMDCLVEQLEGQHWHTWTVGKNGQGFPTIRMYRPRGKVGPWQDSPAPTAVRRRRTPAASKCTH